MRLASLLLIATVLFTGCSDDEQATDTTQRSVRLGELSDLQVINDEMSYIDGSIYTFVPLDENRYIISDQKPGIYLVENNMMTAQYGRDGQGPCEYSEISGTDIKDGLLYVLDSDQTKIITYDVSTQECVGEFSSEGLNRFTYLHKLANEDAFIAGHASYMGLMPDSTTLLRKVYSDGRFEDIDFTLGRINTVRSVVRLSTSGMEFVEYDDRLYSYFPLTDSLHWYHINNNSVNSFPLNIDIQREEIEDATGDPSSFNPQDILDVINNGYTFVTRIMVTNDWIAVATAQNQPGEEPQKRRLKFYQHDGTLIAELPFEHNILGMQDGRMVQLIENSDPEAESAYSIGYRDIIVE